MDRLTMTVSEMAHQLGISKPKAYELVKREDFPAVFIGKRIIIPVHALEEWLINSATNAKPMSSGH